MKYKAVIFDLGGTLIANTLENTSWRTEMAAILSAPELTLHKCGKPPLKNG